MPKKNAEQHDEEKMQELLSEVARDSLRRGESKEQHADRLRALRDTLDVAIEAAES